MNIRTRIATILTFAALVLIGAAANPARASLAPSDPVVSASGSDFTYTYDTTLSAAEKVVRGDFLTIAGIADYVPGSVLSTPGFSSTVITSSGITDITWMATAAKSGVTSFHFGFLSTTDMLGIGTYAYSNHSKTGQTLSGSGTVQVPAVITPEPSSLVSFGLSALVVLGLMLFGRSKRSRSPGSAIESFA